MSRSQWGFCLLYYLCLSRISRFFRFLPRVLGVLLRFRLVGDLMQVYPWAGRVCPWHTRPGHGYTYVEPQTCPLCEWSGQCVSASGDTQLITVIQGHLLNCLQDWGGPVSVSLTLNVTWIGQYLPLPVLLISYPTLSLTFSSSITYGFQLFCSSFFLFCDEVRFPLGCVTLLLLVVRV